MAKQSLTYDIRAEVWLAYQSQRGLAELVVRPQGTFSRPYSPDVLSVEAVEEAGHPPVYYLDVSREGLYDMLPEALFHPLPTRETDGPASTDELIAQSRRLQQEKKAARQFLLPFEQETFRQRIFIEAQEQQTLTQATGPVWNELYDWLLGANATDLSLRQKACLLSVWANAHRIVGDWDQTAAYLSQFLDVPVRMEHGPAWEFADDWVPPGLGESRLGLDWILPTSAPADDAGLIRLSIGPLTDKQLSDFVPNGRGLRLLELISGYLLPAEADVAIEIIPETPVFELTESETSGRLGLTTLLT